MKERRALQGVDAVSSPLVLVVDDDPGTRYLISLILERKGCRVRQAADAATALASFDPYELDLALVDVGLPGPGMDGLELLSAIKDRLGDRYVPVVLVTGRSLGSDVATGLGLGAADYLRKPFETSELWARVEAALKIKRLQDQLQERNDELARLSRTDPVTGISNRRQLDDDIVELCRAAGRHRGTVAAMVIDVDHFKAVNDRYGHQVGDRVLRIVAGRIRGALRATDIVGRWGGDEFVVLLPRTDLPGALTVAERLGAAVAEQTICLPDAAPISVTVSIGVAADESPDADDLLGRADLSLYQAKSAGRGRVAGD
jgi:diguanylate cyclase (GGDEF)-like protein